MEGWRRVWIFGFEGGGGRKGGHHREDGEHLWTPRLTVPCHGRKCHVMKIHLTLNSYIFFYIVALVVPLFVCHVIMVYWSWEN
jgi:hypothetical protein